MADQTTPSAGEPRRGKTTFTYDRWMESVGIPIHRGFYIADARTMELGRWEARGCEAAFIQLAGQEGISEARVSEIPAGESLPPLKLAFDEVVYVLQGRGLTSVWSGGARRTFEWAPRSMFFLPHNCTHQLSNAQGDKPVRLLHYNYLPLAMSVLGDPQFFFNNPYDSPPEEFMRQQDFYSEAKIARASEGVWGQSDVNFWSGNFFPDMQAWDRLDQNAVRGAGGRSVFIQFTGTEMSCHMSVFPARTYKKAHRHGPGRVIVIPGGEGYSIMWQEGQEKVTVPWHEGSLFVPPNKWFHQHFNLGGEAARYLAFHPPMQFYGYAEKVEDRKRDQIEYPDEDSQVRGYFEEELGKRGLTSLVPNEAYRDRDFVWKPAA